MSTADRMAARVLSLSGLAAAGGAFFYLGPPGASGLVPLRFEYAVLGAVAAACGFLALTYSWALDRGERWVCRAVAAMAIVMGLFHASVVLPLKLFFGR